MNFFKSFGYVTTAHAVAFANDLKLAHYIKVSHALTWNASSFDQQRLILVLAQIPPRHTFMAQMVSTLISTFVCTGVMNFQVRSKTIPRGPAAASTTHSGPSDEHPRRMHRRSTHALLLPRSQHLLHGLCPLGHHRPHQGLWRHRPVRRPAPRLSAWYCCHHPHLALNQVLPAALLLHQAHPPPATPCSPFLWRRQLCPVQLQLRLACGAYCLAQLDLCAKPVSGVLEQVQFCPIRSFQCGYRHLGYRDVVQRAVGSDRGAVVGKHTTVCWMRGEWCAVSTENTWGWRAILSLVGWKRHSGSLRHIEGDFNYRDRLFRACKLGVGPLLCTFETRWILQVTRESRDL